FQAEDGIRDFHVTGVQTCALPILSRTALAAFRERINKLAAQVLGPADLLPRVEVDLEVGLDQVDERLVRELDALAPFGPGNPTRSEERRVGKECRLRGTLHG